MSRLPFRFKKLCFKKVPVISFISFVILIIFYPFEDNLDIVSHIPVFFEIPFLVLLVGIVIIQITAQNRKIFLSGKCRKIFSSFMPFFLYIILGYAFMLLKIHYYSDKYFLTFEVSLWDLRSELDLFFVCVTLLFASGLIQKFIPYTTPELDYQEFHWAIRRANRITNEIKRGKEITNDINNDLITNFRVAKRILEENMGKEDKNEYFFILSLIDQLNILIRFLEDRNYDHRFFLVEYGINFKETYPNLVNEFNHAIKFLNHEFREELNECTWIGNFA